MNLLLSAAALLLLYIATLIVYRLYLHPLSHVPGPKIAAITTKYNAYHDLVRGGQYVFVVEEMHRKYGPIVRVHPDVVHISDPRFIDKLYSVSTKQRRERFWTVTQGLQADGSMLASRDHDLHKRRRGTLAHYFSPQNIRRLQPVIDSTLRNLYRRLDGWAGTGPVSMNRVLRAATKDVIEAYALGDGDKCLDMEDCNAAFFDIVVPGRVCYLGAHMFPLAYTMKNMPPSIMLKLVPRVAVFANFMTDLYKTIDRVRDAKNDPDSTTIFHDILRSPDLPIAEKTTPRVGDEAMVLVIAGSETTASTLAAIIYHMLSDRKAMARLKQELSEAMSSSVDSIPDISKIEKLPYLNAVIEETLRLYPGATHRQDRLAPDEALQYSNPELGISVTIPAGCAIGMTAPISNRDKVFWGHDADEFVPDRFLDNPQLKKNLLSFSKGTRQCLGIHLAYAELQTFTAGIFHKYDLYDPAAGKTRFTMELYKTQRADISMAADYVTPAPYEGSQGLRVVFRA